MSGSYVPGAEELPTLVLKCVQGSHPFHERTIVVHEVIKVGRSVARAKPSDTNAIFDCKVLSRSHALLWYKNGHFWLRDTNSSNGTFVNNTRVVKKVLDGQADREIFSGDIIRFGVDVVEHDTTHGCIIAKVSLFHPNGVEAKYKQVSLPGYHGNFKWHARARDIPFGTGVPPCSFCWRKIILCVAIPNHTFQEALLREQILEGKLESMNRLLQETREVSEAGWQAMLNEERLLQKLDLYESQLSILKQDLPQDSLQSHLYQALEEKMNLEKASEIMLARVLNEKTSALSKATNLECCLTDSERECARLRQDCETTQASYQALTHDYDAKVFELRQLEAQLQEVQNEKENIETLLRELTEETEMLRQKVRPCTPIKLKPKNVSSTTSPNENDTNFDAELNGLNNGPVENPEHLGDKLGAAEQLEVSLSERADQMREQVALAELNELDRFCELQEFLTSSDANLEQVLDSTSDDISMHLTDSLRQFHQSMQLIKLLQDELSMLSQLKTTIYRELKTSSSDPSNHVPNAVADEDAVTYPNQSDEVSMFFNEDNTESGDHGFSAALSRVRNLAVRVAACHARAEASLSSYCALQKQQQLQKATAVCHTSGDVGLTHPDETRHEESKLEEIEVDSPVSQPIVAQSAPPDSVMVAPILVEAGIQSVNNEQDITKLHQELQASLDETEMYKQLSETFKQQDAAKADLLLSVREECDTLRQRIAHIEADVVTSREDHQRLVAEARRTRSEANELRRERDALNEQVSSCTHRIEHLQAALAKSLLCGKTDLSNPKTSTNLSTRSSATDTNNTVERSVQSSPVRASVSNNSGQVTPDLASIHTLAPGSILSLFAVIPIMVVLCALTVHIFSKFAR
ncbi:hypothetical protein PHET_02738 [Paragonimus heterotremus]|uniref:FHA domain-containing protein n=1 Tax=Paragonimus heterotremus TaxID=100268 RepID=A0A8J4SFJ9_9TREM|nr:hypothetical protein PHET_02738 [Paragonimus heterotremus]